MLQACCRVSFAIPSAMRFPAGRRDLIFLCMKRVAVFGNAGGGKSTLAKRLAELTKLPLYPLDSIKYRAGGGEVPRDAYLKAHTDILRQDQWIIDGFGCVASANAAAADQLDPAHVLSLLHAKD